MQTPSALLAGAYLGPLPARNLTPEKSAFGFLAEASVDAPVMPERLTASFAVDRESEAGNCLFCLFPTINYNILGGKDIISYFILTQKEFKNGS